MKNPLPFMNCVLWTFSAAIAIRLLLDGQYFVGAIVSLIVVFSAFRTWRRFAEWIFEQDE